jgi:hypothetical protein
LRANRQQVEVTKEEFEDFVARFHPPLNFDGIRYSTEVPMRGHLWLKPMAAKLDDKYYLIKDA